MKIAEERRLVEVTQKPAQVADCQACRTPSRLVAGEADAAVLDGFGEAAADGAEDEGGNVAFGLEREIGSFAGEFEAAVKDAGPLP